MPIHSQKEWVIFLLQSELLFLMRSGFNVRENRCEKAIPREGGLPISQAFKCEKNDCQQKFFEGEPHTVEFHLGEEYVGSHDICETCYTTLTKLFAVCPTPEPSAQSTPPSPDPSTPQPQDQSAGTAT